MKGEPKRSVPSKRASRRTSTLAVPPEAAAPRERIDGVVVGVITRTMKDGTVHVRVSLPGRTEVLRARVMASLPLDMKGQEVALTFEGGDVARPIVLGPMRRFDAPDAQSAAVADAEVDGTQVTVRASETLVLRCGDASITLTRAGKIILRGSYVLSRASGLNCIQGGAVEIN